MPLRQIVYPQPGYFEPGRTGKTARIADVERGLRRSGRDGCPQPGCARSAETAQRKNGANHIPTFPHYWKLKAAGISPEKLEFFILPRTFQKDFITGNSIKTKFDLLPE